MRSVFTITLASIVTLLLPSLSYADVTISREIRDDIARILENPVPVYKLDLSANNTNFKQMDKWFSRYIDFGKAERRKEKRSDEEFYRIALTENNPIAAKESGSGVRPRGEYEIWYVKEPRSRIFVKEIRVPSKKRLPDAEVIDLGERFITGYNLCRITDLDRMHDPVVVSRRRMPLKDNARESDKETFYHSVEFRREFAGLEVVNSKQSVDIHPDTKEVLAYRNITWTPVEEDSGELKSYISLERLIDDIESAFDDKDILFTVVKVEAGMFQTDVRMFPVLLVHAKETPEPRNYSPEEPALILPLVEFTKLDSDKTSVKEPKSKR